MKRFLAALLCVPALALVVPAVDARTLRWASQGDPQTADPHSQNENLTNLFAQAVHDTLVMRDNSLKLVPGLATSWQQVDATTWRFTLRQGVRFHDGTPFTADDVIFSWSARRTRTRNCASTRYRLASRARSTTSLWSSCRTSRTRSRLSTRRRSTS